MVESHKSEMSMQARSSMTAALLAEVKAFSAEDMASPSLLMG
jgi:hypothetical protein